MVSPQECIVCFVLVYCGFIFNIQFLQCEEADPCYPGVECTELDDGYLCGACPVGYRGSPLRGYDLMEANSLVQVCYIYNVTMQIVQNWCMTA